MKKILLALAIIITMVACESRSARLQRYERMKQQQAITPSNVNAEKVKVVILPTSKNYATSNKWRYKVKVLDEGTVGFVVTEFNYEPNDTIMVLTTRIMY